MRKLRDNRIEIAIRLFFVALFLSYYSGATLFYHTHNFEYGIVSHSHHHSTNGCHTHSQAACQAIDYLSNFLFYFVLAALLLYAAKNMYTYFLKEFCRTISLFVPLYQLRAPPVM